MINLPAINTVIVAIRPTNKANDSANKTLSNPVLLRNQCLLKYIIIKSLVERYCSQYNQNVVFLTDF